MTDVPALDLEKAAKRLFVHPDTVRRLVKRGKIQGYIVGGQWRIDRDDLESYIARQKSAAINKDSNASI